VIRVSDREYKSLAVEDLANSISEVGEREGIPWRLQPGTLFSLWDMKDFYAQYFFTVAAELQTILVTVELLSRQSTKTISPDKKLNLVNRLSILCQHLGDDDCGGSDFGVVWTLANSLRTLLSVQPNEADFTYERLVEEVRAIERSLQASLMRLRTLYIPSAEAQFYTDPEPFGPLTAKKFKKFSGDITEAAKCLALDRNTAVVFHLMRVMEYAVQRMGRKLGLTINPERSEWGRIMTDINNVIDPPQPRHGSPSVELSPLQRARRDKYRPAVALLTNVKNAWRNKTMHPRVQGYTKQEAERVFHAVKAYLEYLAPLI
jgi:hypothetical protein